MTEITSAVPSPGGERSLLPALIGVVVALLLWAGAEDLREKLSPLQQQLKTATQLVSRGASDAAASTKAAALGARAQRAALEARLQSDESVQMTRARLIFDLRQKCAAASVRACSVKLSDEATPAPQVSAPAAAGTTPARSGGAAPEVTLEALGIGKARAVISGTFQGEEMMALYRSLAFDSGTQWRINSVVVRGNSFELDVERHLRAPAAARVRQP